MLKKPVRLMMVLCLMGLYSVSHGAVGSITGTVTDKDSGERLPFVRVAAFQNGQERGYATTNFSGEYRIESLPIGAYDVSVRYTGYSTVQEKGVGVSSGVETPLSIQLEVLEQLVSEAPPTLPVAYPVPVLSPIGLGILALVAFGLRFWKLRV